MSNTPHDRTAPAPPPDDVAAAPHSRPARTTADDPLETASPVHPDGAAPRGSRADAGGTHGVGAGRASSSRADETVVASRGTAVPETTGRGAERAGRTGEQTAPVDPALDKPVKRGISGTVWAALILGVVVLILLLVFIIQNNVSTRFEYMAWEFSLPLGVAMLFSAIAGALIMALVGSVRIFTLGHRLRKLEKERQRIRTAVSD